MQLRLIGAMALLAASTVGASAQIQFPPGGGGGGGQDCQALWVERNTYYKNAGYCFRTQRAIQYFGNEGCSITNESQIRFPPEIRARIQQIIAAERAMGCPR